jgi:hypothetical protein
VEVTTGAASVRPYPWYGHARLLLELRDQGGGEGRRPGEHDPDAREPPVQGADVAPVREHGRSDGYDGHRLPFDQLEGPLHVEAFGQDEPGLLPQDLPEDRVESSVRRTPSTMSSLS